MTIAEWWDSTEMDLYNFFRAKNEKRIEDIEQMYDYTRRIMWASIASMNGDKIKPSDLIPLTRDQANKEMTAFEKQELKRLMKEMDNQMGV